METHLAKQFNKLPFGPLNGVLVVEIGQHVSGPMAAEELARQGALVIKLEQAKGDPSRTYLSKANFASLNAGKLSVVINKNENGFYLDILMLANVIIDNRSPEAKEKDLILQNFLNISDKNHPVIFCSIVGYDSKENKHRRALDVSVQAETGMAFTNAPNPNFPLKVGFTVVDIATAFKAASHISAHLFYLKNHSIQNVVVHLEVSMAKVAAQLQTGQYLKYAIEQKETHREGNRDIFLSPFSFYKTQDGMISLAVIDEGQFNKLCQRVLKREDFIKKYPTNKVRLESDTFEKELSAILLGHSTDYWIKACEQQNIPCSKVNSIHQVMQEPFSSSFFTQTTDNTLIIANAYLSSLFKEEQLPGAPNLNEHHEWVKELIHYHKKNDGVSFASLWQTTQRDQAFAKFTSFSGVWKNPNDDRSSQKAGYQNNSMSHKL
jgi:crotonobetainyl-CoA:carnitine CoA-transferase CaiB-like acyl-CoA transferase